MATYDYLKSKNGHKIQVESAKRDGAGKNIENNYAKQNGYYAQLTSGNADQLNSTIFVTDQVPYLFRTSGGDADIGNREYDKIIGGSLVVNQLVQNGNFESTSGWGASRGTISVANNVCTYTISVISGSDAESHRIAHDCSFISGHKYLLSMEIKVPRACKINISSYLSGISILTKNAQANTKTIYQRIVTASSTGNNQTYFSFDGYDTSHGFEVGDKIEFSNCYIIDLTQMFGSTIADYILSLEQDNTGAGVSWFRQYFQELYYPYNTGAIKNVQLISHDMVGFNQWDEETRNGYYNASGVFYTDNGYIANKNPIPVLPNTAYELFNGGNYSNKTLTVQELDVDGNFIRIYGYVNATNGWGFTTSPRTRYIQFNNTVSGAITSYTGGICLHLQWSGWRNGQYEPYKKNSYPLDATIELRGIPKLDADNHLYFDGDEYTYGGKIVRKYIEFDLGSLTYTRYNMGDFYIFYSEGLHSIVKYLGDGRCPIYIVRKTMTLNDKELTIGNSSAYPILYIRNDTYTDETSFKAAMSGVMFTCQLANTTEETAEPYQEIQIVDDFGTEEYVVPTQDGWQIPVGHDTKYPANLRDKLQRLPDMPSVSQNVTETYVVNYNGTTKKCTFAEINAWLSSNGYVKQVDLSDQITDVAGLTYQCKKAIKIGNVVTITIQASNSSGNSINAGDTIFKIGSALQPSTTIVCFCRIPGANTAIDLGASGVSGNCTLGSALSNGAIMRFTVSYIVA